MVNQSFQLIDLIDSAHCQLDGLAFAGKVYHQFEPHNDVFSNRIFEKAKAGLVFESFQSKFQMLDIEFAPSLIIVSSNAAHHSNVVFLPMYCRLLFDVPF